MNNGLMYVYENYKKECRNGTNVKKRKQWLQEALQYMMRNQLMRNRAMVSYKTQLYGKKCGPTVGWLVASCEPVEHATTPALLPGPVRNPLPIH
jgi:hypothetical protein